ncbi:transporter substrate-binding domain-containing protein [Noviherbaspirillum sp. CPCC 100848]|uniref:Transporter substrate-binding domain-containing protein n=1 Tax=Noviherbaspirillum album TaxID=3080276 RepID=A0ABU6JD36_9BURK|nr:transporter substrate-binding domain-containing protein [Noviherbaspirillum sp. CPCC 100848]MEC4721225.1 transporter substrate-binding domain-containing protein [Noviherbaspirillum sp. CPCC 100848]
MNRRNVLSALVAGVATLACTFAHADVLDEVIKNKTLRVAVPQDFPPFGSVGVDLKPVGYDIDVAKLIAGQLGVVVEIVPVTSANRIPYLSTKKVDLVISSLGKNAEREKVIDFSDAYAPFFNGVFGLASQKVTKAEDLVGKTVGVTRGAIEDLELTKIAPNGVTIKRFEDNNTTISAFLAGQVPLVATGNIVAASISEKQPNKKPEVKFLIKNSPCHIGLNKNETRMLERVNMIIANAKKDGSLNRIADKWLKAPLPADL